MPQIISTLLLAAVLTACAGTNTQNGADNVDASTATAEDQKPKQRCYREKTTGSRLGQRVCVSAR